MLKKYQIYQHQLWRCSHCEPQASTWHNSMGLNVKAIKVMVALVWASTCVLNLFEALLFDALLVVWSAAVTLYRRSTWKAIDLLEFKLSTPTNSSHAPGLRHWQEPRKSSRSQRPRVETSIYLYLYIIWYQLISYWFILTSHYSLMLDSILSCLPCFYQFPNVFPLHNLFFPWLPSAKPRIPRRKKSPGCRRSRASKPTPELRPTRPKMPWRMKCRRCLADMWCIEIGWNRCFLTLQIIAV